MTVPKVRLKKGLTEFHNSGSETEQQGFPGPNINRNIASSHSKNLPISSSHTATR